jgi:hypothetical protein
MTDWHIKIGDEVIGPVSGSELLKMVRSGEVTPETPLQKGDSRWVLAEEVNGLFEAIGQKAIQYYCPDCGDKIHRPPTHCEYCGRFVERAAVERLPVRAVPEPPKARTGGKGGSDNGSATSFWQRLVATWKGMFE